jgi:outer membrane receptor protein involved in Fe transport
MTLTRQNTASPACRWQRRLLPGCIMLGLLSAAPAMAQDASAQPAQDQGNKPATDLGVITVTAQGREQDIITVPYNISSVSGETIEDARILDVAELMRRVPGVGVVDRGPRNSSVVSGIRIRGLNVDSSALGDYAVSATSTVASYVDSVPLLANFLLTDIERVEVLRGPQGTLYGSGSLGGTVRYILRKPELGHFGGWFSLSGSSVKGSDGIGGSGTVTLNVPLADAWALRFTGTHNDLPGVTDYVNLYRLDDAGLPVAPDGVLAPGTEYWSKKDADTVNQDYGRVSLLWKPSDRFDATLSYMAQSDRFGGRRGTTLGSDGWGRPYQDSEIGSIQLEPAKRHVHLTSLEANVDLGFATLTSSTSYYDHRGDITSENTGFYAQNGWYALYYYNYPRPMSSAVRDYGDRSFAQELRLASKIGGSFDYVAGVFYQNQFSSSSQDSYLRGFKRWWDAALPAYADAVVSDRDFHYRQNEHYVDIALYGELTWHLTDTLELTGGVRSFRDDFTANVAQTTGLWAGDGSSSQSHNTQRNSRTLFKGNLAWWFSDNSQLYATVSQGYRRGGANGTPVTGNFAESPAWLTYRPDTVLNYELGVKGSTAAVTYNANVFYVDWKDPQLNTATTWWGFFAVQNMGKAETKGIEVELSGHAGQHFDYGLGYTYTDATLAEDAYTADGLYLINRAGAALPGVSKHHVNANASYTIPLGSGQLVFRGDASYQSSAQNALSLNPKFAYTMPGFTLWNASASYTVHDWTTTLWVKNLTNQAGITGIYTEQYMGTSPAQNYFGNGSKALTTLPRTIGLTLSYRF